MKHLLGLLVYLGSAVLHAESYPVVEDGRVTASIALHELNRIKVADDRIAQVFGNEGAFLIETEERTGQIFIKPNSDKPLNVTVVTESQRSIDLQLMPAERDPETLVLRFAKHPEDLPENPARSFVDSLADLLVQLRTGEPVPGFRRAVSEQKPFQRGEFSVQPIATYEGASLTGGVCEVTNISKEFKCLTESAFLNAGIAAIALERHTLAPHQSTKLYWVKKHG